MTEPLRTFRDAIRMRSPRWLRTGLAEKVLYTVGLHLDGLTDALVAAVKMRFPGYYSVETLSYEGRQRRIPRGRHESDQTYAERLIGWLDAHRTRGGPYSLLRQLHEHFAPNNFAIELLYSNGRRYVLAPDGTITWDTVAWTPPGDPSRWARWWLFYHAPQFAEPVKKWGGFAWGDGTVWSSGLSGQDVADLRLIPVAWGNAHSTGHLVILDEGETWETYEPGQWPRQIALKAMTDPLVPVDEFAIDNIIPPEDGQDALADVPKNAFQQILNALLHLKNRVDDLLTRGDTYEPAILEMNAISSGAVRFAAWERNGRVVTVSGIVLFSYSSVGGSNRNLVISLPPKFPEIALSDGDRLCWGISSWFDASGAPRFAGVVEASVSPRGLRIRTSAADVVGPARLTFTGHYVLPDD